MHMDGTSAAQAFAPRPPGVWMLLFGVVYPAVVIGLELAYRWCAQLFFDPMPTSWHVAIVCAVPAANLALWIALRRGAGEGRWLSAAGGFSIAVAACYALIFLPLLPLAFIAILFMGVGLLPFGPLSALITGIRLVWRLESFGAPLIAGLAAGFLATAALDAPMALTRHGLTMAASGNPDEQARGVALLRAVGDRAYMLRVCYDRENRVSGPLSGLVTLWDSRFWLGGSGRRSVGPAQVRETWYRVTGTAFNSVPAPALGRPDGFSRNPDADRGLQAVGGRVQDLRLVASRLDGSLAPQDAVSYLEWTLEFRNDADTAQEARLELGLPPGGVVSKASLWINGVEQEAAVASKGQTRAAYQAVVRQQRDPLLVTTRGADRVLVQAFPVPPGDTLKLRLGITAPMRLESGGAARFVPPSILDHNLTIEPALRHALWVESAGRVEAVGPAWRLDRAESGMQRARAPLSDAALAAAPPALVVRRDPAATETLARVSGLQAVLQVVGPRPPAAGRAVVLVVDGSASMRAALPGLRRALGRTPKGAALGLVVAGDRVVRLDPAPWSDARRTAFEEVLQPERFVGGQDDTAGLVAALEAAEGRPGAEVLWVHGPQPVAFQASAGALEQALARRAVLPDLTLYPVAGGANAVLPDQAWTWRSRMLARTGSVERDVGGRLAEAFGPGVGWGVERRAVPGASNAPGSPHVAPAVGRGPDRRARRHWPAHGSRRGPAARRRLSPRHPDQRGGGARPARGARPGADGAAARRGVDSHGARAGRDRPDGDRRRAAGAMRLAPQRPRSGAGMSRPLLLLGLLGAVFWDAWAAWGSRLEGSPQDGLPMLAVVLVLGGLGVARLASTRGLHLPPLLPLAALLGLYAAAAVWGPVLVRLALAAGTLLWAFHHVVFGRPPAAVFGLAALALPVLPSLDFFLAYPLRMVSAALTVVALQGMGLSVEQQGVALVWRGQSILFDAPCSGVRMLWAGLLLASGVAYLACFDAWRYLTALGLAAGLAVLGNVLRASSLFWIEAGVVPLHVAALHEATGLAAFGLTAVMILLAVGQLRPSSVPCPA
jgi:exosortase/archaeosortase family protein